MYLGTATSIEEHLCLASPQHDMTSPLRSRKIPDAVLRIYEQQYITLPLFAALSKLQDELQATGNTEAPFKRVPYNKTPELSWGRQSPQLTPTPSPLPSPPPKTWHRKLHSFPTPDTSPLREDRASASPTNPPAKKPRRPRHKPASGSLLQSHHVMLRHSRARIGRAQERRFWELDASGRRARRIDGG
ncbi:hypothetical protein BDW02DRAFT_583298 [Decorospora gaudefroyi]|uniref:Uncharacterized protein n=1 Tax=Decorospora gaudefroyi TaxID=184978 RepID=A0A6A5JY78_9PLEO|nr:hypothetical protein BDW02DRAFT_583298 [Decorospora gaudefroyi]